MTKTGILKHLDISTKVVTAGLTITGLFVLTIFAWIIPGAERGLLERKREKIREATETAWSVMQYYQSLVAANELSLPEAQRRAATVIKHMRYGPEMKDYFWINDMRPYMIMHPYRADLDGKDLADFKDPNGVALFVEFVKTCRQQGAGFVRYSWQWKDDESNVVPKISYVRLYRPWQWIVGTGMYIEDVRAEIRGWRIRVMIISALVAFVGVFLSWRIGQEVAKRVRLLSRSDSDLLQGTGKVWRLQSMVMLVVVPALAFMTVFWCVTFYESLTETIINGFDNKLAAISSTTGCFIRGEDHDAIVKAGVEDNPLYRKYVVPMRRIIKKTGLTYLYTQVLIGERPFCNYVLDASEGEEHTEIGYKDKLPLADYQGAENVLLYGIIHKGGINPTEGWGLIKVCYAPIYHDDDTVNSMAGADVNISAISDKTRTALFAVGLLAVCAICGTGYITHLFSTRFQAPIRELRDAALMIAGGNHDHQVDVREPKELRRLSSAFNRIGNRLKETLAELRAADRDIVAANVQHDLMLALDKPWVSADIDVNAAAEWLNRDADKKTSSGWVAGQRNTVTWLGKEQSALDALNRRCRTAAAMMKMTRDESDKCRERIEKAGRGVVRAGFVVGAVGSHAIVCEPVDILALSRDGALTRHRLERNTVLADQSWRWLIVSDEPDLIEQLAGDGIAECTRRGDATAHDLLSAIDNSLRSNELDRQVFVSVLEVQS